MFPDKENMHLSLIDFLEVHNYKGKITVVEAYAGRKILIHVKTSWSLMEWYPLSSIRELQRIPQAVFFLLRSESTVTHVSPFNLEIKHGGVAFRKNLGWADSGDLVAIAHHVSSVVAYMLLLSLIEYKTLVMRDNLELANEILPSLPKEHHKSNRIPKAALMAQSYLPSKFSERVAIWRNDMALAGSWGGGVMVFQLSELVGIEVLSLESPPPLVSGCFKWWQSVWGARPLDDSSILVSWWDIGIIPGVTPSIDMAGQVLTRVHRPRKRLDGTLSAQRNQILLFFSKMESHGKGILKPHQTEAEIEELSKAAVQQKLYDGAFGELLKSAQANNQKRWCNLISLLDDQTLLSVPKYLQFKEELVDGQCNGNFVLELHLSAKMFHDKENMHLLLDFLEVHNYKGKITVVEAYASRKKIDPREDILRFNGVVSSFLKKGIAENTAGNVFPFKVNEIKLGTAGEASQRSTKEDWLEWMRHFSIELLKE
ncbi:coatomer subunit beta-2 [Actinidia rufa]|uniref:sucrose synthase n=1 Tax=Actinidia rufa TaxID=165716 RepID=A0A7J0EUS2_9ERIC|nr:coatomer subunit beta-2 [Actinidia rufa]